MATAHATVTVARELDAAPARVFAAWASAESLQRWYLPTDEGWTSAIRDHRFEVGGGKRASFALTGGPAFGEDCRYEAIDADARIVYTMTILRDGVPVTASIVTVELEPVPGGRTRIAITDQLADLGGADESAEREEGWRDILDRLAVELRAAA